LADRRRKADSSRFGVAGAAVLLALAVALLAIPRADAGAGAGGDGGPLDELLPIGASPPGSGPRPEARRRAPVRVKSTGPRYRALVRSLPISRRRAARPVAVASLPLRPIGRLRRGVGLEVSGELQVTVCLRPAAGPPRRRGDCVGRVYGYDPRIRVRLALAPAAGASGRRAYRLGRPQTLTCRQSQPNRNHHCSLSIPWHRLTLGTGGRGMPNCAPASCHLNLIATASHPRAGPHNRVIVGGIDRRGRIDNVGESGVSAIRYGRRAGSPKPRIARRPLTRRLPVVPKGSGVRQRSIFSVQLPRLRAGERLKLDGRYAAALGRLPYNVRTRIRLVLADSPDAVGPGRRARRATRSTAYIPFENNFNCTRGPSGHRTPCPHRKSGVVRIGRDSDRPLYANLIAGHGAIGLGSDRRRARHRVPVRRGGFLKVWRHRPPG
jgi:hypothetical protein